MSNHKNYDWENTRLKLVVENGSYKLAQAQQRETPKIGRVWFGAIFLAAEIDDMRSFPEFEMLEKALSCYFVEYISDTPFWKLYWSRPPEYGHGAIFQTKRMKEDPPKKGERYFNDAIGQGQYIYDSTFTLLDQPFLHPGGPSLSREKSFVYRQHFDGSIGAFLGGLNVIDFSDVPNEWRHILTYGNAYEEVGPNKNNAEETAQEAKNWFNISQEEVRRKDYDGNMTGRLIKFHHAGHPGASIAILRHMININSVDQKTLDDALSQMLDLGFETIDSIASGLDHPIWDQGDYLIPKLTGIHPILCLQYIQKTMTSFGFNSQEDYRHFIERNGLETELTPFAHARNNATFALAWLLDEEIIRGNGYENYSNYNYSVTAGQGNADLRKHLNDANERIRDVLFNDYTFEQAEAVLLGRG